MRRPYEKVSYRMLSRALKVHNNVAKRMLYDFYQKQNQKNKGSVHANYLIEGLVKSNLTSAVNGHHDDGEDTHMQSSPFMMSSSAPQGNDEAEDFYHRSITLAREQDLEDAKKKYSHITSVHIYSLQAKSIQNLQALSECNRIVSADFNLEDPLAVGKQYGVIQNLQVRRRTARRPPGVAPVAARGDQTGPKPAKPSSTLSTSATATVKKEETKPAEMKSGQKSSSLKRESSDIFKSFSKAKPKTQVKREDTNTSTEAAKNTEAEDVPMKDDSESDAGDDTFVGVNKADPEALKARKEREEQNRKMMEDEDESENESEADRASDASPEPLSQEKAETSKEASPEAPPVVVSGGRRRGRRRVPRTKTVKDEDGYLVTQEEMVWESFSEDEPASKNATPQSTAASLNTAKKKGGAGAGAKASQGNIMSFFGKK